MKTQSIIKYFTPLLAGVAIGGLLVSPGAAAVNVGPTAWVWQNPLPQGNRLKAITCSSSSTGSSLVCKAVGDLGTIIYGDGGGGSAISWYSQTSGTTQTLRSITCTPGNGNNCLAVGDGGTILGTANDGVTWTSQSSGTTAGLTAVSCLTTTRCIAIGSGLILVTGDLGAHWSPYPHFAGAYPTAISCPGPNTCYVTANNPSSSAVVMKTINGGITWPATSGTADFAALSGISCGSVTHCVAVDSSGHSIATSNGGDWGPLVTVGNPVRSPYLSSISCWDALDCIAVGSAVGGGNNLYSTNDGAASWHGETSGADSTVLNAVSCPASTCVAVGEMGEIVTNSSIGFVYTNVQTSVTNKRLTRVTCVTTNDCWAVGDGGIFATIDGGTTWKSQYSTYALSGISCPSATTCFAVGGNLIFATTDGGKTWTSQPLGTSAVLNDVSCPTTTTCFAGGTSILSTTDGKTWHAEVIFSSYPGVFGIACPTTTTCVAVGYAGGIFTTSDGNTWKAGPQLTSNSLQDVRCSTGTICVAVGDNGTTVTTTTAGKNWSIQPYTTTKNFLGVGCLVGSGSEQCYAGTSDGYILSTGSAGALWAQEAQLEGSLAGTSCAGIGLDYRCMVVGPGGTIVSAHFQHSSGGGGGGGHCGTPSNPCPQ